MANEILRPNASGNQTAIHHQTPDSGAHWDKVDEVVADDNTTTVFSKATLPDDPPFPEA